MDRTRQARPEAEARSGASGMAEPGSILAAIGHTPLVELRRLVPRGSARVVAKLESANPTGSMKDRLARILIERAAAPGGLPLPGPRGASAGLDPLLCRATTRGSPGNSSGR